MLAARPKDASNLDFVQIEDFTGNSSFDNAIEGVDGVIHVASVSTSLIDEIAARVESKQPLSYTITDNEKELIRPAINGVKAILTAAAKNPRIKRIVLTSSFASVIDVAKNVGPGFTYTGEHWNPLTYEEAVKADPVVAYRGSKKFAELEAWNFLEREKPGFDLVALCPPMTFGPVVHPIANASQLNESNAVLWSIATGANPLPVSRVPVWIDVRDLAKAHVEALLRPEIHNKRYVPTASEKFSYGLAAEIMRKEFPWAKEKVTPGDPSIPDSYDLDWESVTRDLGIRFRSFKETVVDLVKQVEKMPKD